LLLQGATLLHGHPQARERYYLYEMASKNPPAFGRWWNYYQTEWRRAERIIYARDSDRFLTYCLRPNSRAQVAQSSISINSRGFRGREISPDKGNAYRIVALGESTTFDITLNAEDRPWPELLEQLIGDRLKPHRPVEVINAGIPGYRLDMNLHRLPRDILPLKPDLIISYHGVNGFPMLLDALPDGIGAEPPPYIERPLRLLAGCEYRLKLLRFEHRQLPKYELSPAKVADPLATPYAQLYRQLIQVANTNHIKLGVATYSMAANVETAPEIVRFYQTGYPLASWAIQANVIHNTIVRGLAAQHPEVCLVDTRPHLDGEHDKFIDLVHFAAAGDQQMAETFFAALKPILEVELRGL
jgi:lysophospholipase L1-like esterase